MTTEENNGHKPPPMRILDENEVPAFIFGEDKDGKPVRVRVAECRCPDKQAKQGE